MPSVEDDSSHVRSPELTALGRLLRGMREATLTEPDDEAMAAVDELFPRGFDRIVYTMHEVGGHLRLHETVDIDRLTPVDRAATELLRNADVIRADASDAMPPDIGTDLLWEQITSWVGEEITYDQLAVTIDDARAGTG